MDKQNTRILITGGSGFIGTNLVDYYTAQDIPVLSLDVVVPKKDGHRKFWKQADIMDENGLREQILPFNPTHVFHLAARTDLDEKKNIAGYAANTIGTQNVINVFKECRDLKRVLFTSSMYVCRPGHDPKDYDDYLPHTVYGESKVLSEKIVKDNNISSYEWVIIRPTSIWGPWFGHPYNEFFHHVARRTYFDIKGKTATKTYGFIGNSIYQMDTILFASASDVNRKTFYIGDHPGLNINDWALEIAQQLNQRLLPMPLSIIKLGSIAGDILNLAGVNFPLQSFRMKNMTTDNTISLLKDTLKIAPATRYSMKEGVSITLQWLREHDVLFRNK